MATTTTAPAPVRDTSSMPDHTPNEKPITSQFMEDADATHEQPPPPFPHSSEANEPYPDDKKESERGEGPFPQEEPDYDSPPAYPEPNTAPPTALQAYKCRYTNWAGSKIAVTDPDDTSRVYYAAKCRMTKPHMMFSSIASTPEGETPAPPSKKETESMMATMTFHALHTHIDSTINGSDMVLTLNGRWKSKYSFPSTAQPGTTYTWKWRKASCDLLCVNQDTKQLVAKFLFDNKLKAAGRMELYDQAIVDDVNGVKDEIVVTGLGFAQLTVFIATAVIAAAV